MQEQPFLYRRLVLLGIGNVVFYELYTRVHFACFSLKMKIADRAKDFECIYSENEETKLDLSFNLNWFQTLGRSQFCN